MKSKQLDISIETLNNEILIVLEGLFFDEQVQSVQEKIESLIIDGHKLFLLDMHHCEVRTQNLAPMLLEILNNLKGRGGNLIILMSPEKKMLYFAKWSNLFSIYQTVQEYHNSGFVKNLKKTGIIYSKKTGMRLSPGVAAIFLVLLGGWLLTLISIIRFQEEGIAEQTKLIHQLEVQKDKMLKDITSLQLRLAPLKDLGLVNDSLENADYTFVSDWVQYLEVLEKRRNKKKKELENE
ncbi:MAG: hypothetical protein OCD01_08935 [Fibrobacterales bacterium]